MLPVQQGCSFGGFAEIDVDSDLCSRVAPLLYERINKVEPTLHSFT